MGQSDLAKLLNVSRDNVASYERGSTPKLDVVVRIVSTFHIDLKDLVEKDLETSPPEAYRMAAETGDPYQRTPSADYITESLKKLVKVQEKYIQTLEEKIKNASKPKKNSSRRRLPSDTSDR